MLPRLFCNSDPLRLSPLRCDTLLFSNTRKYFNQNVVYHLKNPVLLLRKFHHVSRDVKDFDPNVVLPEVFQFFLDVNLSPTESIQRFNNQGISVAEKVILQRPVPLTLQILAAYLVRNDIPLLHAGIHEGLELPIQMLFSRRYTGITVCLFQLVFISFSVSKAHAFFGHIPK